MPKHGKKFTQAISKFDLDTLFSPMEAVELVKSSSFANFDETVEVHLRTSLDPRQADQQIRDVVVFPNGLGKTVRLLVFAQGEAATAAREAGADFVADTDEETSKSSAGYDRF